MTEPIVKTLEVPCDAQQAFDIFVNQVAGWWPLSKNTVSAMSGGVAKSVTIEPRVGGRVYEIGPDDTEHHWGTVTAYEPGRRLTLDWHINSTADEATEVDVVFSAINAKRTRVQLTHHRWEALGDRADQTREGYNSGWVGVFDEAYAAACAAG